ncbi:MAG: protein kinase, partial [Moorea sp. SIO2B7]|nr:protein kinase [Moorena sp. SIO2B7]
MSYCINPYCLQPDDPGNVNNRICRNCGSQLLLQGRYQVMRLLSDSSGFGKVYEAYEGAKPKILKVLKLKHNDNERAVELFKQEAEVLSQLNHPGIPKVEEDGYFQFIPRDSIKPLYCIIMEKIEGLNLTQWMEQQGNHPISEKQAFNWLKQLVEILNIVHKKNFFHRDIKPQNIMIRSRGQLVLIDFGTAREMTNTYLAQIGSTEGITRILSAGYTPPEQEKGYAIPQSDFYALGRTFVYLLTGKNITNSYIYDPLTDKLCWHQYAPNISNILVDLIDKMIATQAINRPKNTEEILNSLEEIERKYSQNEDLPPPAYNNFENSTELENCTNNAIISNSPTTVIQKKGKTPNQSKWLIGGAIALILSLGGSGVWQVYKLNYSSNFISQENVSVVNNLTGHLSYVNSLLISHDGQKLISGSADKKIKVWDLATGAEIRTLIGHSSFVNALFISHDGQTLVSGSADKTIKLWNLNTGAEIRTLRGHSNAINALAISHDGQKLISGSADKTIKLWDLVTGKEIRTITGHSGYINDLVISPDGQTLISASADKTIRIWNLNTGAEIRTITGHYGYVNDLVISPDGQTLISGSADKTIKIWDLVTGKEIRTISGHLTYVNHLEISPDGEKIVSGSSDKTIKFWDL